MTSTLVDITLTTESYTLIAESIDSALLQIKDPDPARIVVAESLPVASSKDGLVMNRKGLSEIALNGLDSTDKIYGIAIRGVTAVGGIVKPTAPT